MLKSLAGGPFVTSMEQVYPPCAGPGSQYHPSGPKIQEQHAIKPERVWSPRLNWESRRLAGNPDAGKTGVSQVMDIRQPSQQVVHSSFAEPGEFDEGVRTQAHLNEKEICYGGAHKRGSLSFSAKPDEVTRTGGDGRNAHAVFSLAANLDFIRAQTGRTFRYDAYRREVGPAVSLKDADPSGHRQKVEGYLEVFGRNPNGVRLLYQARDIERIAEGKVGFIISFSSSNQGNVRAVMEQFGRYKDLYQFVVCNSDPGSPDNAGYHRRDCAEPAQMQDKFQALAVDAVLRKTPFLQVPYNRYLEQIAPLRPNLQLAIVAIPRSYFADT